MCNFPLFLQNVYIFPLFRKKAHLISLLFSQYLYTSPYVRSIYVFVASFLVFAPPNLTIMRDASMHRALHVLDASGLRIHVPVSVDFCQSNFNKLWRNGGPLGMANYSVKTAIGLILAVRNFCLR